MKSYEVESVIQIRVPTISEIVIKVDKPTHGGWFCYDLRVGNRLHAGVMISDTKWTSVFTDIRDDSRWWRRLWHWIAEPIRRLRGWGLC